MADEVRHTLHLEVRVDELRGIPTPQLIPWVDGSVLFCGLDTRADRDGSGLGMDPDELLGRDSPLLPREPVQVLEDLDEKPPLAVVWRCSCGEPGDASIRLRVSRVQDSFTGYDAVVWDDWRLSYGFARHVAAPPELRFDTRAYYEEFIRLATDRWWDTTPRQVARELVAILDARPELLARWGSALLFADGYVQEGHGAIRLWLRHRAGRYELTLACPLDADAITQASGIAEQLGRVDPAHWNECRHVRGL
jgi:hypothetical protein